MPTLTSIPLPVEFLSPEQLTKLIEACDDPQQFVEVSCPWWHSDHWEHKTGTPFDEGPTYRIDGKTFDWDNTKAIEEGWMVTWRNHRDGKRLTVSRTQGSHFGYQDALIEHLTKLAPTSSYHALALRIFQYN